MEYRDITILAVDDDEDDLDIFCQAVRFIDASINCVTVQDGSEALTALKEKRLRPSIIFLDFNMPRMNGKEILDKLQRNKRLKNIPVVMYSTFFSERDRAYYNSREAMTLEKPVEFKDIVAKIAGIIQSALIR